jgi:hypothetical protein
MADIFFSYSREYLQRILSIVRALEKQGFTIFWDRTTPAGKSWREVTSGELEAARCVMVAWSATSISLDFAIEEAHHGKQQSTLVPLLLGPV